MKKDKTLANNPTLDDDYLFSASCQDCTGLIPSVTHDEDEVENYEALYPYLPPVYNVDRPVEIPKDTPQKEETPEVGIPPTIPEVGTPSATSIY